MNGPIVQIRRATDADLPAIREIYNFQIENGVATFDLTPWSEAVAQVWLADHVAPFCALVAVNAQDEVVGFSALSPYRSKPAYKLTAEDTVHVRPQDHRRGVGRALVQAVVDTARDSGFHAVVARIEASNEASIALHLALGFFEVGHEREVGFKFGQWLDVVTLELLLPGDLSPNPLLRQAQDAVSVHGEGGSEAERVPPSG